MKSAEFKSFQGGLYVNGVRIEQFITQSGQSSVYRGSTTEGDQVIIQILQNKQVSWQRIKVHQMLADFRRVPQLIDFFLTNEYTDSKNVSEENKSNYVSFFKPGQIICFFEYFNKPELCLQTFSMQLIKPSSKTIKTIANDDQIHCFLKIFIQIIKTVQQMHNKCIFHLDIKPDNILASMTDFRIIDLGSAQFGEEQILINDVLHNNNEKCAYVCQTTQAFSSQFYDAVGGKIRCGQFDVYSLGASVYTILTGKVVGPISIPGKTLNYLIHRFGFLIADLIVNMLNPDPLIRYTIKQVINHPLFKIKKAYYMYQSDEQYALLLKYHFKCQLDIQKLIINNLKRQKYDDDSQKQLSKQVLRSKSTYFRKFINNDARLHDDQDYFILQMSNNIQPLYNQKICLPFMSMLAINFFNNATIDQQNKIDKTLKFSYFVRNFQSQFNYVALENQYRNYLNNPFQQREQSIDSNFSMHSSSEDFLISELNLEQETSDSFNNTSFCSRASSARLSRKQKGIISSLDSLFTKNVLRNDSDEHSQRLIPKNTQNIQIMSLASEEFDDIFGSTCNSNCSFEIST